MSDVPSAHEQAEQLLREIGFGDEPVEEEVATARLPAPEADVADDGSWSEEAVRAEAIDRRPRSRWTARRAAAAGATASVLIWLVVLVAHGDGGSDKRPTTPVARSARPDVVKAPRSTSARDHNDGIAPRDRQSSSGHRARQRRKRGRSARRPSPAMARVSRPRPTEQPRSARAPAASGWTDEFTP